MIKSLLEKIWVELPCRSTSGRMSLKGYCEFVVLIV
jgi:hypothetical protein